MNFVMGVADGVDKVRAAVREELRQGADAIKIMVSGGVASPYDPLDSRQFSLGEIAAAVEEATAFNRYVLAHAYTPEAITRAVSQGVRTIEHGNLIDAPTAKLLAKNKGYMIANLVAYVVMKERAAQFGMSADMLAKNDMVLDGGLRSLEICKKAGVKVGYGSDLLGQLQNEQSREFLLRSEVMTPIEILRSATTVAAEIIRMEGKLGIVEPGAYADLIVVDGNPLKDFGLFQDQGEHLSVIMKEGRFHKNRLAA
jgi:imidazolonepropionase-like amidohydrolase